MKPPMKSVLGPALVATGKDWAQIHRRLETMLGTDKPGTMLERADQQNILAARANVLARIPDNRTGTGKALEVVTFQLANEPYGFESCWVREVYPMQELTPVPCTPPFVCGLINVRGQVVSVIDLKQFFGLPEKGLTELNKVIILRAEYNPPSEGTGMEFGILADVVTGIRLVEPGELRRDLITLAGVRTEYLKGITADRLIVLDAEKLLSAKEIIIHQEVT